MYSGINIKTICRHITGCLLFFFFTAAAIHAQPNCKVEYYSTEHGLSHQRVNCMLKDREGFMWFGSWNGVHRFDGHAFVSYKSHPGDRSQLRNDRIDQIVEDRSGYLWVEAYDQQIYRFNKRTEQFTPLSSLVRFPGKEKVSIHRILAADSNWLWLQSDNQGLYCVNPNSIFRKTVTQYRTKAAAAYALPSDSINFFHKSKDDLIWIGTPNGLCCLSASSTGVYKANAIPAHIASGVNITAVDEDTSNVYFSTATGNLIIYDKVHRNFTSRKIADCRLNSLIRSKAGNIIYATSIHGELIIFDIIQQSVTSVTYRTGESLHNLYEDRKGRIWIEPAKRGCILFNPAHRSFQLFTQKIEDRFNSNGNRFRILEDNNNVVWLNLKGGGFGYYDESASSISNLLKTPDGNSVALPKIVYGAYYDPAGIIWLTTNETKLVKIILQGDDFKQQLLVKEGEMRSDNEVRGIYYDNKNRLWVGAKSGELYVYQNGRELTGLFVNAPTEGLGLVYSILQDSRGNIWMGTKGNGLFKATPVNKEETKYHLSHFSGTENKTRGLAGSQFYALLEDKQGRIWLGSFGNGLTMVDEKHDSIKFIHTRNDFTNYPKQGFHKIRHMASDGAGNIWIATTDGLVIMDAGNRQSRAYKYVSFTKVPGDKESLGHNDIQFIYRDSKDRMWLTTSGGGLSLAAGNPFHSLKFQNFTVKEGMPNDYVLSCVEDSQGKLWIATENGLSRFDPGSGTFRNYDSYDGLPKASYSEASVCHRLPDGRLIFGTTKGLLSFDPVHINSNRIPANIVFTNVQINNEDAGPGMNEAILKDDINYVQSLRLKHNQNIVSIDYSILDFRAGQRQAFAYRLLGFDSAWHDDRQQHRVTYTNLPPGHYVFEVKNISPDRYSNAPYRRLEITILPPVWKTWWAYTIYIILTIALILFIRRIALAMIRLRHKVALEQKLAALKLNFFTNVSHELRTPLTLIINPLEQISKKEMLSPEGFAHTEVARRNAERMVRFINQLLDLRKVQSDKATLHISRVEIIGFVKKISEYFTDAAAAKRIQIDIDAGQKELITWIDADKLDVVIYNLLGNALKFTPAGKKIRISIHSIPGQQTFSIAVHDQGPGVKKEKLEKIFELFHEEEAASATALKGTGIGLALSKEFITLHGGTIVAANNDDGGLTVTVTLKLDITRDKKRDITFANLPVTSFVEDKAVEKQVFAPSSAHTDTSNAPLVLLVEDNDELRDFLRNQLSEFYRVEVAVNGQEGWQKAKAISPDLIISDIMMPVMDGIQMLDHIKNDVSTSHIPVVLLSAKYSIESQIEGLRYGADYYITKPFNSDFLLVSINNLLRQRKKLFESFVQQKKMPDLSPSPIIVTSKDEAFLKDVVAIVEEKMADPDFNIDTVAETVAMSRTTFYKKFKSLTSLTPVEFVRDMRLQRAMQYLDAGGNNISEVAYLSGFSNPKYFSTCFREKYNVTPTEYLKSKVT